MSVVISAMGSSKAPSKADEVTLAGWAGKEEIALGDVIKEDLFDKVTFGHRHDGSEG